MAQIDLHPKLSPVVAFNIQAISSDTTTNGTIVSMSGYHSLDFAIQSGTLTTGTYTPLIEHGDASDLSDATTVSADYLSGTIADATFAATDDNAVKHIGYVGKKAYVRLSIVSADTASGTIAAVAIKGDPGIANVDAL